MEKKRPYVRRKPTPKMERLAFLEGENEELQEQLHDLRETVNGWQALAKAFLRLCSTEIGRG